MVVASASASASLLELPADNLAEILSRLPIKTILACRCACKTLLNLISSDRYLTNLYASKPSNENLIIQFRSNDPSKHIIHFIDDDPSSSSSDEKKLQICPIFKIPKWKNIDKKQHYYSNCTNAKKLNDFALVNACKGLLYFAVKSTERPSVVCNPITNQCVKVPEVYFKARSWTSSLWLGYSHTSRTFKVLRIYTYYNVIGAHIHDVGSFSWRHVESKPSYNIDWDNNYALVHGYAVFWLCQNDSRFGQPVTDFIVYFDFAREIFGKIRGPPGFDEHRLKHRRLMSIGMVGDLLCLIDNTESLDIWMVNKRGNWIKQFSGVHVVDESLFKTTLRPLQLLNSGEILMISGDRNLVSYDPKKNSFRLINFHMMKSNFRAVTFFPCFASLNIFRGSTIASQR